MPAAGISTGILQDPNADSLVTLAGLDRQADTSAQASGRPSLAGGIVQRRAGHTPRQGAGLGPPVCHSPRPQSTSGTIGQKRAGPASFQPRDPRSGSEKACDSRRRMVAGQLLPDRRADPDGPAAPAPRLQPGIAPPPQRAL